MLANLDRATPRKQIGPTDYLPGVRRARRTRSPDSANTSMRIPRALRDAAALAVSELGAAPSTTALANSALRATVEAAVLQAVLDDHYVEHPDTRPALGALAIAAAEIDGHPLSSQPERLRRAAAEIAARHPHATAEDVLLWAEAQALATT
jgi:hypothetical protein